MPKFQLYDGNELMNVSVAEDKYLIENVLWENDHMFIIGKDKVGKSILALQMACALTSGDAFLSKYSVYQPMSVLYLQMEGKLQDTVERLKSMTSQTGVAWDPDRFFLLYYNCIALDTQQGYGELMQIIKHIPYKPEVIFLDPLYMAMEGDLIDNKCARNMVKNLRQISETLDCSLVILHHQRRPVKDKEGNVKEDLTDGNIFGSFVWKAFADHLFSIHMRKDGLRLLTCNTQRTGRVIENVELKLINPYPLLFEVVGEDQKPYVDNVYHHIKYKVDNTIGITIIGLTGDLKLSKSAVEKSVAILQKEGKIIKLDPKRRPAYYVAR